MQGRNISDAQCVGTKFFCIFHPRFCSSSGTLLGTRRPEAPTVLFLDIPPPCSRNAKLLLVSLHTLFYSSFILLLLFSLLLPFVFSWLTSLHFSEISSDLQEASDPPDFPTEPLYLTSILLCYTEILFICLYSSLACKLLQGEYHV